MQSIFTKYHGPTNKRGSRIKATASGGASITISVDNAMSVEKNHDAAAIALCKKIGWEKCKLVKGGGERGKGNVYVMLPKSSADIITVK